MDTLQDYYGQQYSSLEPQRPIDGYSHDQNMDAMDTSSMGNQQTLDQMLNGQEPFRCRQPLQPQYRPNSLSEHSRRASLMEFGTTDLADFQFDPNPTPAQMPQMVPPNKALDPRKVRSREDLSIDTRFAELPDFDLPTVSYSSALLPGSAIVDPTENFMPSPMDMQTNFHGLPTDMSPMTVNSNATRQPMFTTSPISQNFPTPYTHSSRDPGGGASPRTAIPNLKQTQPQVNMNQNLLNKSAQLRRGVMTPSRLSIAQSTGGASMPSPAAIPQTKSPRQSFDSPSPYPQNVNVATEQIQQTPLIQGPISPSYSRFQNVYSSSGFDMLGVLMRVATRRNPEINIGPVDLSCAFVVCDIEKHDLPIVYCSDMFERLTGYTRYEILGRNCRFLQAPDGRVQSGVKRKYVDDRSILYLKNQISKRAEAQLSLINYRKGGQPFMNLLTMIPIRWDAEEYRYYIGFQVDLVEQPSSLSGKNPDGTYAINYNRSAMPAYTLPPPPDPSAGLTDIVGTIPRDEVSQVLATIGTGESDLSRRIWDKVLLENTDDVVHVLSLKGLFLYLSPASRRVLEYDASELVGTPLSSVCHPSDIVPVTRELKDSSGGAPISVVYRIRRKNSGYTWFEAYGCLHTEQGKGRKCIILVGRERPVYALDKNEISNDGGLGDSEMWSKLSTAGMFLYVSSNCRAMLDRVPEDMIGTSLSTLMRPESRKELMRALESARTGEKVTLKHDLQNRRGQVLQAQTTIYPGDARKGFKPTFLLGQTRLLKMTRATLLSQKPAASSQSPGLGQDSVGSALLMPPPGNQAISTPASQAIALEPRVTTHAGSSALPLGNQDEILASEDNVFDELKTTRSSSWQFELRQMERQNRLLAEELQGLISRKKRRKKRKGLGQLEKDCANCHTRVTPEWRRGPSGQRDLCNSCGLRWAKQNGRVSPRKYSSQSDKGGTSPAHGSSVNAGASKEYAGVQNETKAGQEVAKKESDTLPGNMPAKIEEGEEPPHSTVLPT